MDLKQIREQLEKASNILLIAGGVPSVDTLGSSLALMLGLNEVGKRAQVVTPNPIRVEHSRLVGCDKVETKVGASKSFVISLPQAVDTIEKVSCYAEGKTLNIVLQPYPDVNEFDPSDIQYSKASGTTDAIVLVDVVSRQEAQKYLQDQANLLNNLPVIALGKFGDPSFAVRFVEPDRVSTAQIILVLLETLGVPVTADIANNLQQALYEASDDFHAPFVTPDVFEDAAKLLKAVHGGVGRVQSPVSQQPRKAQPIPSAYGAPPMPGAPRPPLPNANRSGMQSAFPNLPNLPKPPIPGTYGSSSLPPLPTFPKAGPSTQPNPYRQSGFTSSSGMNPPYDPFAPLPPTPPAYGQGAPFSPNASRLPYTPPAPPYRQNTPGGNRVTTNQEWEVDPFLEFDKTPDDLMPETMGTYNPMQAESPLNRPSRMPNPPTARETFQSATSPTPNRGGGQSQRPNFNQPQRPQVQAQSQKGQNQPKNKQNAADKNQPKDNTEDDWTQPRIYKTEDLL